MSFQQYEALLKTVELGSFTKAATELGYTQSGISHMLASLERECGCTLLYRDRSGVRLSAEGELLLPCFRAVVNAQQELSIKLDQLKGLESGFIRIGTITSVSVQWLPSIIQEFNTLHPNIEFSLHYGNDCLEIEKWLADGIVDCGFVTLPLRTPLVATQLKRDPYLAVLPPEHPLTAQSQVTLEQLAECPFIRMEEGSDNEVGSFFAVYGLRPDVRLTAWDNQTIVAMISKGLGVSLLPELMLNGMNYHFCTRPLSPPAYRDLAMITKDDASLSAATRTFANQVRDWVRRQYGPLKG